MTDKSKRPIIVIKKKVAHAGHHGGAWKVAYADFVTAMMALFIVLWLTSSGEKVRKSIAGYFNDPTGTSNKMGTDLNGGEGIPLNTQNISDLKERLQRKIAQRADLKTLSNQIEIAITPEGMRIELIESKDGTFFESGSAVLNGTGRELLTLLAKELGAVPNRISTEGHTDAQPYSGDKKYDNWELSTDRANSARRLMQIAGLRLGQVSQVRGFADQQLRVPANPLDPSNRRVSVIVHYIESAPPTEVDVKDGDGKQVAAAGKREAAQTPADAKQEPAAAADPAGGGSPAGAGIKDSKELKDGKAAAAAASGNPPTAKPSAVHALLNRLPSLPSLPTISAMPKAGALLGRLTSVFSKKPATPAVAPSTAIPSTAAAPVGADAKKP